MSETLVVIQALATLASLGLAFFLARLTVNRDRELRLERLEDDRHEQVRRLVDALRGLLSVMEADVGSEMEFEIARAQIAAALALYPANLRHIEMLLAPDMPSPPYAMGHQLPWMRLRRAQEELLTHARSFAPDDRASRS